MSQAIVTPPATIAGPSSEIADFGGVAMAPDGSGGAVYLKTIDGVPHVFASRYVEGRWGAPLRVDGDIPYEASQPRIAAGRGGELLVVWVTQVATVAKKVRYGLYSASIGRGASSFGPSLLVDPEVGDGSFAGVDPSLSGTGTGQAVVAYRVIAYRFEGGREAAQLRPGDVLADVRVARLKEDRWSRLGAINVNQELSTRPPSASNGPQVGAGTDGNAVVAWQESDQSGTARIYLRRIFGTVPGPILQASPSSWEGTPVSGDADAFSLAVTPLDQARIAMRVEGNGGPSPARLFLNTLPPGSAIPSNQLLGAKQVFSGSADPASVGLPGIAASEKGGGEGFLRLGFVGGGQVRQFAAASGGGVSPIAATGLPQPLPGAETVAALEPEGGGTVAYPTLLADGLPGVAVRQEFSDGGAQLGLISGAQSGPVAQLQAAGSGAGDALIGFRQGEPGHFQIVVDRVGAAPASFHLSGPRGWTSPRGVRLTWASAASAVGGVRYAVVLGGRTVKQDLKRRRFHPKPWMLGNGTLVAQVQATDLLGQQVLSKPLRLRVDSEPPTVRLSGPKGGAIRLEVRDGGSGVKAKSVRVSFGDGSRDHGGAGFKHAFAHPGRYAVIVAAADEVGNRATRRFEVRVR